MSKRSKYVVIVALSIGGLIVGNIFWGKEGALYISIILFVSIVSGVISRSIRKRRDREAAEKYGSYGEIKDNDSSQRIHDSKPSDNEPHV
ncbi:hypothetical protein ACFUCV_14985 [Specibacter sp. NPDC057265]|uniref:hypothetical protein n=1 Tax=Specibacter sp. NPDC057265 TaxID=3346075 RepID=UPI00363320F3